MRKFIIVLFFICCIICRVSATEGKVDVLSKMENAVFGVDYSSQKTDTRLKRLEESIYGRVKNGNPSERIKALAKDMNADVIGQEITPSVSTPIDEYVSDNSVEYPIIDDVEKQLKLPQNTSRSLHSRLVAIEKKLFNSVYDTDDFYTRVERIKGKVYKTSDKIAEDYDDDMMLPEYSAEDILFDRNTDRIWDKYGRQYSSSNKSSKISRMEKEILNNTYPDESNNDRLARLENTLLDTEFYYDDENERIRRLEGTLKGQKTSNRYDNNKLQQRLNTAMQIGAMILMVLACIL